MGELADQVDSLLTEEPKGDTAGTAGGDTPGKTGETRADSKTPSGADGDTPAGAGEDKSGGRPEGDAGGDSADKDGAAADEGTDGYVADEGDDEGPEAPDDKAAETPSNLSPDLQYVVDNLPVLSVRGKDGKTYQIKAAGQLPDDFDFANKREEMLFTQALAGQELKAQQLQSKYFSEQQNKAANEFSEKENKDIRRDIGALQREGSLPRFKLQPDDPKFNDDPAVKQAQEVIDFMNKANAEYLDAANKGGVLYHLSFRDAYRLMQQQAPKTPTKQDQEDKERKEVIRKTAGAASSAPTGSTGNKAPSNFSYVGDLKDMVDMMDI